MIFEGGIIMTKTKKAYIIGIITVVVCAIVFIVAVMNTNKPTTIEYHPDWSEHFTAFNDAYINADCVVTAKVSETNVYERYGIVFTDVVLDIDKVYKGNPDINNTKVIFTGGIMDNVEHKVSEIVIPEAGNATYLFLLSEQDNYGSRGIMGGYQGIFKLSSSSILNFFSTQKNGIVSYNPENNLEQELLAGNNDIMTIIKEYQAK